MTSSTLPGASDNTDNEGVIPALPGSAPAAGAVASGVSGRVSKALADHANIRAQYARQLQLLDRNGGGIEDVDRLPILEDALIGYDHYLVTVESAVNNLRKALNQDGKSLGELVEKELSNNPEGNIREIMDRLLGQLEKAVIDGNRERIDQEYTIIQRVWAVAGGAGVSSDGSIKLRDGKIEFHDQTCERVLRKHFPNLVQYIG